MPVRGRPFEKGQSGNPGGRPKGLAELKEACQLRTERNLKALDKIISSKDTKDADRIRAIDIQLERAYGKAIQEVKGVQSDPFTRAWTKIAERAQHVGGDGKVRFDGTIHFRSAGKGKT